MLYENYRNKVLRLSAFLSKVVKHMALIITICSVVLAAVITLLLTIGLPGKVECTAEVIYGDSYDCLAKAFLSDVRLEYAPADADEWSEEKPYLPGSYQVRAVGSSAFGKDRYGKSSAFAIVPFPLQVRIGETGLLFGETPTFVSDTTKYGDRISCDGFVYADISAASTAVIPDVEKIRVLDAGGMDVTYAYDLQPVPVTLTFQKRPLELLVESATKIYDGVALTYDQYQVADGYTLGPDDTIIALFTGIQTDAGSSENTCTFTIQHIQDGAAIDVTGQYDLMLTPGTLAVDTRPLMITTGSLEAVYTGQNISCQEFTLEDPSALLPGHTIVVESWGASLDYFYNVVYPAVGFEGITSILDLEVLTADGPAIDCGTYLNVAVFKILDENGNDVTANYDILQQPGTITIKPAQLTVYTDSATWEYDGKIHDHLEYTVEGLLPGHQVGKQFAPGAIAIIQNAGTVENRINLPIVDENGNDVTNNYVFDNHFGTLEVTKRPATIITNDASWVYDGITHERASFHAENILKQHEAGSRNWSKITYVGTKENRCDISIVYRSNDQSIPQDVTDNYDITFVWGTLEITPRPLTIYTDSAQWIYDDQPHDSTGYMWSNLADSDEIQAYKWASITDAGQTENTCSFEIYARGAYPDAVGYEPAILTENYTITYVWGTLEVLKRPITIGVVDEEKVYDGKPLLPKEAYVTDDSPYLLVEDHTLVATFSGSRTTIGTSESKLTKVQIFSGDRDVTFNYDITTAKGKLTVLPEGDSGGGGGSHGDGEIEVPENTDLGLPEGFEYGGAPVGQIKDDQSGYVYLRQYSYGNYTGHGWEAAKPYGKTLPGKLSYNYLSSIALINSGGYIHIVDLQDLETFMLPYYLGLEGDYEMPTSDIMYSGDRNTFSTIYYSLPSIEDGFDYLKGNLGDYSRYEKEYRKFVYQNYLTVDAQTQSYMQGIIDKEGFSLSDPSVILKIARYIQNSAVYAMEYDRAMDEEENVVIAFLDQYKEGICQHYASAATLLYRTLGIPARYTVGFMPHTQADTFVDIMPNSAHAWVEVYIDGVGWMQVEVTGGSMDGFGGSGPGGSPSITIAPNYAYKNYDGTYLYPEQQVAADSTLSTLLDQGYTYDVVISGKQREVGQSKSVIEKFVLYDPSGADVTANFDIIYEEGLLEVFPANVQFIRVYLYQLQKYYDGDPLAFEDSDYEIIEMPKGVTLELRLDISLTEPGSLTLTEINKDLERYATYTVYQNGKNVTSQYQLIFDTFEGTDPSYVPIRVDQRPIEITSASQTRQDNGEPLSNDQVFISQGSLVAGHKLVAKAQGTISGVGTAKNTLTLENVQILDAYGNDVTACYDISIIEGLLTITPPSQ